MAGRIIEIGIEIVRDAGERTVVAGRCFHGPVRLGDTFDVAYRYNVHRTPEGYGPYGPSDRTGERPVALRVEALRMFKVALDQIDEGDSAEVELSGEGRESLQARDVVGAAVDE